MPKGRGSNKKGGGPTPPRPQPPVMDGGIPPQIQLLVQKQQMEQLVFEKAQAQTQVNQLVQLVTGVLLTKRGHSATLTLALQEKIQRYSGITVDTDDDGVVTVSLGAEIEEEEDHVSEAT